MKSPFLPSVLATLLVASAVAAHAGVGVTLLDAQAVAKAAGTQATVSGDVVRIGWRRDDVEVEIDGVPFPPAAGLGSWAAFRRDGQGKGAVVTGDTVVFRDEVDAAMDAAFAHHLSVTGLHNHFFYDRPKVYFLHIAGHGPETELASSVRAVWDAIQQVRAAHAKPADGFPGATPKPGGKIDAGRIQAITGLEPSVHAKGVVKISTGRTASLYGTEVGGSMGLTSWAAFTGSDSLAAMDGDFIMSAAEVQPVLHALRAAHLHVVALHNHMIGEQPSVFFTHFWGKGPVAELAAGFKGALDAQKRVGGK